MKVLGIDTSSLATSVAVIEDNKLILWANLGSIFANKTRAGINMVPPPIPIPPIIPAKNPIIATSIKIPS